MRLAGTSIGTGDKDIRNVVTLTFWLAFFYVLGTDKRYLESKWSKVVIFGDKVTFYGVVNSSTFAAALKESA